MFGWLKGTAAKSGAADRLVAEGVAAGASGRSNDAVAAYEAALRQDPDHVDALRLLGLAEAGAGRSDSALARLAKACALRPDGGANHHARHQVLLAAGNPDAAIAALAAAVACADAEPDWLIELGLLQERHGRLADAVATWRRAAVAFPDQAVSWWNLARVLEASGLADEHREALAALDRAARSSADSAFALGLFLQTEGPAERAAGFYRIALEQDPEHRASGVNLGAVLLQRGETQAAIDVFTGIISRYPEWPEGWLARGSAHRIAGQLAAAEADQARAVELDPESFASRVQYAITLERSGRLLEAEAQLHAAISLQPNEREAHFVLGNVLRARQLYDEAEAAYWRAIELGGAQGDTDALLNLSSMQHRQGRFPEAVAVLEELLRLKPDYPEALGNLGVVYRDMGRAKEAEAHLKRVLELRPDMAGAHINLANLYGASGRNTEAEAAARAALALEPDNTDALVNLGNALQARGRIPEFVAITRRILELKPQLSQAWSNLLFSLNYSEDTTPAGLLELQRGFGRQFDPPPERRRVFPKPVARPKRKLRIGYMSPDFRTHVVAFFFEPVLARHDRSVVDVHCYFTHTESDGTTRRIRDLADVWREVGHLPPDEVERVILEDDLDVMIDLAGHTAKNMLPVLARRVAPVQATWLGYPSGTGLASMDWRITDRWADPAPAADAQHVERLYRLPEVFIAFQPVPDSPAPGLSPPRAAKGHVTFCSFNNFVKITDGAIRLWAAILAAVPDARLAIKTLALRDEVLQRDTLARFAALAVDTSRLDLQPPTGSHREHLTTYAGIDIALDTFPYHGTTTTCEALWMGVPVVTLAGDRHASRVGVTLLTAIGCEELVATTPDEYVAIAVALAQDPERTAGYRQTLRRQMADSPLGNVDRLVRQLEAAYLDMHSQWLTNP